MAVTLKTGDAVLLFADTNCTVKALGFIRYIGLIQKCGIVQQCGIELIEEVQEGHNGIVNGVQYFNADNGFGLNVPIRNVIRKLDAPEVLSKLKKAIHLFKQKIAHFTNTLTQKDNQIKELKQTQQQLKSLISSSSSSSSKKIKSKSISKSGSLKKNHPNPQQFMNMRIMADKITEKERNAYYMPTRSSVSNLTPLTDPPNTPTSVSSHFPETVAVGIPLAPISSNAPLVSSTSAPTSPPITNPNKRRLSNISTNISVNSGYTPRPFSPIKESPTTPSSAHFASNKNLQAISDNGDDDDTSDSDETTPAPSQISTQVSSQMSWLSQISTPMSSQRHMSSVSMNHGMNNNNPMTYDTGNLNTLNSKNNGMNANMNVNRNSQHGRTGVSIDTIKSDYNVNPIAMQSQQPLKKLFLLHKKPIVEIRKKHKNNKIKQRKQTKKIKKRHTRNATAPTKTDYDINTKAYKRKKKTNTYNMKIKRNKNGQMFVV